MTLSKNNRSYFLTGSAGQHSLTTPLHPITIIVIIIIIIISIKRPNGNPDRFYLTVKDVGEGAQSTPLDAPHNTFMDNFSWRCILSGLYSLESFVAFDTKLTKF